MGSKRPGGTRESCDNCREKKRKCDLSARRGRGDREASCSRCIEQGRECYFTSPNESRLFKRQCLERETPSSVQDARGTPDQTILSSILPELPLNDEIQTIQSQEDIGTIMEPYDSPPSLSPEGTAATISLDSEVNTQSSPSLSALGAEGSLFLSHIFLGGPRAQSPDITPLAGPHSNSSIFGSPAPERRAPALVILSPPRFNIRSSAFRSANSHFFEVCFSGKASPHQAFYRHIVTAGGIAISDFMESLHAYFDFPALHRPLIPEDAFWEDFHKDRCSPVLLLAISCRGIPFTDAEDKGEKQWRLATMFKTQFMKALTPKARTRPVRLDVLEGMALMVDFKYDNANTPVDHFWDLFMTHDALVLMSLQSRKRDPGNLDPSASLARADERFSLLYWDVFHLDAFQCLDKKSLSLISDDALGLTEDILSHEAGSYLDAILSLSIIVRQIVGKLSNATARVAGISYEDITMLHEQLCHWRHNIIPLELQRPIDRENEFPVEGRATRESTPIPPGRKIRLQRAILWALEVNCYLQIDNYVAEYGIKNGNSVQAEVISFKFLEIALEAVNLAHSIKEDLLRDRSKEKPLVDIVPSILRDICADVCSWICSRGFGPPTTLAPQDSGIQSQRRADYAKIANILRDTVAAASSHSDTTQMLGRLDDRIASLQNA